MNGGAQDYEVVLERQSAAAPPAATVIITVFNYENYLSLCLDSVKQQSEVELDLVVVDDASTDGSIAVGCDWLERHGGRFARCCLVRQHSNGGPGRARNRAFHLARTDYVFVLDADNLLYPRCLERLILALDQCDASFAHCYLEKFDGEVGLVSTIPWWEPGHFQYGNQIDAMCLFRRSAWLHAGGYSEDRFLDGWEDFELWFRLARNAGWGVLVPEILARYRCHGQSLLHRHTNQRVPKLWAYLQNRYPEFFTGENAPDPHRLIEEMRHSRSWRMTAPLRFLNRCRRFTAACLNKAPHLIEVIAKGLANRWLHAALRPRATESSKPSWVARTMLPVDNSNPH